MGTLNYYRQFHLSWHYRRTLCNADFFFAFGDGLGIGLLQFGSGALLLGLGLICGVITWKIGGSLLKITFNLTKFIIGKMKGQVTAYGF